MAALARHWQYFWLLTANVVSALPRKESGQGSLLLRREDYTTPQLGGQPEGRLKRGEPASVDGTLSNSLDVSLVRGNSTGGSQPHQDEATQCMVEGSKCNEGNTETCSVGHCCGQYACYRFWDTSKGGITFKCMVSCTVGLCDSCTNRSAIATSTGSPTTTESPYTASNETNSIFISETVSNSSTAKQTNGSSSGSNTTSRSATANETNGTSSGSNTTERSTTTANKANPTGAVSNSNVSTSNTTSKTNGTSSGSSTSSVSTANTSSTNGTSSGSNTSSSSKTTK